MISKGEHRGPISTCESLCTVHTPSATGGEVEHVTSTRITFARDGRIAKYSTRAANGTETFEEYVYSGTGKLLRVEGRQNGQPCRRVYQYDDRQFLHRVLETSTSGSERVSEEFVYSGDSYMKLYYVAPKYFDQHFGYATEVSDVFYSAMDARVITTVYEKQGLPKELAFLDDSGNTLTRVVFAYDSAERLIEEVQEFGGNGHDMPLPGVPSGALAALQQVLPLNRKLYSYDEKGRLREIRSAGALDRGITRISYNELNDPVLKLQSADLIPSETTNKTSRNAINEVRFLYQYDIHNNWTRRTTECRASALDDYKLVTLERRTIQYFEEAP